MPDLTDEISLKLDGIQADIVDWFLRRSSSMICALGTRGVGKTGAIRALTLVGSVPTKRQILYACQSSQTALDTFHKLVEDEVVREYLYSGRDKEPYTTKPLTIRWASGSETILVSMEDHDKRRGLHPDVIIVDEAQSISADAWAVIYPMRLRVAEDARMVIFGTCPEADAGWFYDMYNQGLSYPNVQDVKSFTLSVTNSLAFKGLKGKRRLEQARANMSQAQFDCEIMLKPGGQGDRYLNGADVDACVAAYDPSTVDQKATRGTIMAFDPSLGRQDPQAYTIMDLSGNIILSHSISKDLSDTDQIAEVVRIAKQWRSLLVVESNATAAVTYVGALKTLLPHGVREVPFRNISTKSGEAKAMLYRQMALALEHRKLRINPQCEELIRQLKDLRDYKTPSGGIQIKCPGRVHDDEAACMVICCEALSKGWAPSLNQRNVAMSLI